MTKFTILKTAGIGIILCLGAGSQAFAQSGLNPLTLDTVEVASKNVATCFNADKGSMREIKACTTLLREIGPQGDLRSDIHVRRGLLYLNAGYFEKAGSDFRAASDFNDANEFAYLGEGFVALFKEDYKRAVSKFDDCKTHNRTAPLALYGRAMAREMSGDIAGAKQDYQRAAEMQSGWTAPLEELERLDARG